MDITREVDRVEGERFAKENGLIFLETSAKSGNHIDEAFMRASKDIYHKFKQGILDLDNKVNILCLWHYLNL